ncbi:MAG: dynamin family protein [Bacillaceae bacterium]|nr:dynamin family protein [Bacillaceae bacterium]
MHISTSLHSNNVMIDSDELIQVLEKMTRTLTEAGHTNTKVDELTRKLRIQEYGIAFCGHFSAGKSTLINELLGEHILPSSPIPTSANVVKMMSGSPKVVVEYTDASVKVFEGTYKNDVVQEYCRDGNNVTKLTIFNDRNGLPEDLYILDTPGIDSTDDAHRVAAESTLHIADTVVYMMDYNHIQSEINFAFLKEMNRRFKNIILVVNQVDKHREFEMSFEDFKAHTIQSIENEGITFDAVFFTSAIDRFYLYNELDKLKKYLESIINNRRQLLSVSVWKEAFLVISEHEQWLKKSYNKQLEQFEQLLSPHQLTDESDLKDELEKLKKETKPPKEVLEEFEESFLLQFGTLLNNANLMPYHTRNLARDFLEAEQIGYKVRGLFSTKKTKAERGRRREALYQELKENAVTYIDIHFKDMFLKLLKKYEIREERLSQAVHDFSGQLQEDVITRSQKRGALFSHEYVLNFSKALMDEVKSHYRKKANKLLGITLETLSETLTRQTKAQVRKRDELERKVAACTGIHEIYENIEEKVQRLTSTVEVLNEYQSDKKKETVSQSFRFKDTSEAREQKKCINLSRLGSETGAVRPFDLVNEKERRLKATHHIDNIGRIVAKLPSLRRVSQNFFDQSNRLKDRTFTIALFGAFSSGKSSFANALVGANVLPVSPHPTTATINRILPPTKECTHGTIHVYYKQEEVVLGEVNEILQVTAKSINNLGELKLLLEERQKAVENLKQHDQDNKGEKGEKETKVDLFELIHPNQLQYLMFIVEGYESVRDQLSNRLVVPYEDYKKLVATERFAAFIERIDVYYNSPIAKQGITLVDTPGANSIHTRHTKLAFNFIKHADAIVFLTYYNHAFSKSDREFLIQLGRVKNCFETDKMYFVINAADLAQDEEEMKLVTSHVEKNLLQCGIRFPQIYPISSQLALLAKIKSARTFTAGESDVFNELLLGDRGEEALEYSGITNFETSFYSFVLNDLTNVAIRRANGDLTQLCHMLQKWYEDANKDEASKRQQRIELSQIVSQKQQEIDKTCFNIEEQLVRQEIHELIYYVKQRVFYRYFDEFKELINPSQFKEDADFQKQLHLGVHNVLQFLAHDLVQELRATGFRLEVFISKSLSDIGNHLVEKIIQGEGLSLLRYNVTPIKEMDIETFSQLRVSDLEEEMKVHENSRTFFVEKGNLQLRDKIEERLRLPVDSYLKKYRNHFEDVFVEWFLNELNQLKLHHISELDHYKQERLAVLEDYNQSILIREVLDQLTVERNDLSTYVVT